MEMRKLTLKTSGIEVYMYLERGKTEFIWSPPLNQNPTQKSRLEKWMPKFIPWVRECLGK